MLPRALRVLLLCPRSLRNYSPIGYSIICDTLFYQWQVKNATVFSDFTKALQTASQNLPSGPVPPKCARNRLYSGLIRSRYAHGMPMIV